MNEVARKIKVFLKGCTRNSAPRIKTDYLLVAVAEIERLQKDADRMDYLEKMTGDEGKFLTMMGERMYTPCLRDAIDNASAADTQD